MEVTNMGCNYYLKYKGKMTIQEHNNLTDFSERVQELDNGYVYNNHYYQELPNDFSHILHIGKSSMGWHFSLCIYPSLCINNLEDWKILFDNYEIEDEYGDLVSKDEMLDTITNRKRDVIETEEEKEMFCKRNHCEVGLNNLFAHTTTEYSSYQRTEGTYDLTEDWDFC